MKTRSRPPRRRRPPVRRMLWPSPIGWCRLPDSGARPVQTRLCVQCPSAGAAHPPLPGTTPRNGPAQGPSKGLTAALAAVPGEFGDDGRDIVVVVRGKRPGDRCGAGPGERVAEGGAAARAGNCSTSFLTKVDLRPAWRQAGSWCFLAGRRGPGPREKPAGGDGALVAEFFAIGWRSLSMHSLPEGGPGPRRQAQGRGGAAQPPTTAVLATAAGGHWLQPGRGGGPAGRPRPAFTQTRGAAY